MYGKPQRVQEWWSSVHRYVKRIDDLVAFVSSILCAMEFVARVPSMQLVECATKHMCFYAELFEPRPEWAAMSAYRDTMVALQAFVEEIASRERCPFAHLGIYIDQQGACLFASKSGNATLPREVCAQHVAAALGHIREGCKGNITQTHGEVDSTTRCIGQNTPGRMEDGGSTEATVPEDTQAREANSSLYQPQRVPGSV